MRKFKIDVYDDFYGATLHTEESSNGDWVMYEDVAELDTISGIYHKYEQISNQIESRWKQLIGFGCGYFISWKLSGDFIIVTYERPSRLGGGVSTDNIPMKCFTEPEEEAKKTLGEYVNKIWKSRI